jgi:hypothetical protein
VTILSLASVTYANLYFTFLSFSIAFPIAILTAWCAWFVVNSVDGEEVAVTIGIGLLIGASLVSHSIAFLSLGFALFLMIAVAAVRRWREIPRALVSHWTHIAVVIACTLPYLLAYGGRVASALFTAASESRWGWEWERLPTAQDVVALGNILGFNQLGPEFPTVLQFLLGAFALAASIRGARRLESGVVIWAFTAFAAVAFPRYWHEYFIDHNPLASYSIAKLIFSFADPFLFLIIVGVLASIRGVHASLMGAAMVGTWAAGALWFLFQTTPRQEFYSGELVRLLRNARQDALLYVNTPDSPFFGQRTLFAPIVRNDERLISGAQQLHDFGVCERPLLVTWSGVEATHGDVLTSRGAYSIGYPPSILDFTRSPGAISLVSGFNYWEESFRWLQKDAALFLKPPAQSGYGSTSYLLRLSAIGALDLLRKVHRGLDAEMTVDVVVNNVFRSSFRLRNGENDVTIEVPRDAVGACESFTLLEFSAPYEVTGADVGTTDTKRISWGMRKIRLEPLSSAMRVPESQVSSVSVGTIRDHGNCSLDALDGQTLDTTHALQLGGDGVARLAGWAADVPTGAVPRQVFVELDGRETIRIAAFRATLRPDVAAAHGNPALVTSGWESMVKVSSLPRGKFRVKVLQIDGTAAWRCDTNRTLTVE